MLQFTQYSKPMNKSSKNDYLYKESRSFGENAVTKMILNGLVREARNCKKVGAYGNPVRYQWDVYDSIRNEWTIYRQFGWYRRSYKAFVPIF